MVKTTGISRIDLQAPDVEQLLVTLRHDGFLSLRPPDPPEHNGGYVPRLPSPKPKEERRGVQAFKFQWWGVTDGDFEYRGVEFEGGGRVDAGERAMQRDV